MARDKNAGKRLEYNQQISSKERESEELHVEEHQAQNSLDNFQAIMMINFRQLQEIDENINSRSHVQDAYDETAYKKKYLSNIIREQEEGLKRAYQASKIKLEAEREQLQKERNNLAWD